MPYNLVLNHQSSELKSVPHVQMLGHKQIRKFDPGTLPMHVNPGIEICYIHKGRFDWTFENQPVCALPGTATLTLPWQPHGGTREVMDIGELSWIIIRPERFERSGTLQLGTWSSLPPDEQHYVARQFLDAPSPIVLPKHAATCLFFKELMAELGLHRQGRVWRMNRLIDDQLLTLARALERATLETQREAFNVIAIDHAIRTEPAHQWSLDELCALSGWSKSALNPRVKEATGYSSMEYVLAVRLKLAKEQLCQSDVSITDIAMGLGFSSSQHFSTAFRQRMGMSPSACRNQNLR